jgi:hypothetical protein
MKPLNSGQWLKQQKYQKLFTIKNPEILSGL